MTSLSIGDETNSTLSGVAGTLLPTSSTMSCSREMVPQQGIQSKKMTMSLMDSCSISPLLVSTPLARQHESPHFASQESDSDSTGKEGDISSFEVHSFDYGDVHSQPKGWMLAMETKSSCKHNTCRRVGEVSAPWSASTEAERPGNENLYPGLESRFTIPRTSWLQSNDRPLLVDPHSTFMLAFNGKYEEGECQLRGLAGILGKIRRDVNRCRITNVPSTNSHDNFSLKAWNTYTDICLVPRIWLDVFQCITNWSCRQEIAEQRRQTIRLPTQQRIQIERPSSQIDIANVYLSNNRKGTGRFLPSYLRLGQRWDQREMRCRELLAIVPSHHTDNSVKQILIDNVPLWVWEMAFVVGYCAWQQMLGHISSQPGCTAHQMIDTTSSTVHSRKRVIHKRGIIEERQLQASVVHAMVGNTFVEEVEQENRQKMHQNHAKHVVICKRTDVTSSVDLNHVLVEEERRRKKARANEIALLQRFGLCSAEDPVEEPQESQSEACNRSPPRLLARRKMPDTPAPPLRCGSPSSLDRTLKRKLIIPNSRLMEKKHKGNIVSKQGNDKRNPVLGGERNTTESSCADESNHGASAGRFANDMEVDSTQSPPSPLQPAALDYGDDESHQSLHSATWTMSSNEALQESIVDVMSKAKVLAKCRTSPRVYDEIELSDRAKFMLQALENEKFPVPSSDTSNEQGCGTRETLVPEVTPKFSKRDKKKLRKQAKKARKEAKRLKKLQGAQVSHSVASSSFSESLLESKGYQGSRLKIFATINSEKVPISATNEMTPNQKVEVMSSYTLSPHSKHDCNRNSSHDKVTGTRTKEFVTKKQMHSIDLPRLADDIKVSQLHHHSMVQSEECAQNADNKASIRFLCSETFLEEWGELVGELAAGSWKPTVCELDFDAHCHHPLEHRICFVDTSLLDFAGVDVENQAQHAMIVCLLSTTIQTGFASLIKRVIDIASLSRYATLDVMLCADVSIDASIEDLVRLQNATLYHQGMPATVVSINLVSSNLLASSVADSLLSVEPSSKQTSLNLSLVEEYIEDQRNRERLMFLLSMIPSLNVGDAIGMAQALSRKFGESWFTHLFELGKTHELQTIAEIHPTIGQQLSFALSTTLGIKR